MEMDDHQQHEYGMPDLSQLLNNNRSTHHFIGIPQVAAEELLPGHQYRNLTPQPQGHHHHHYEMLMMPRGLQDFNTTAATSIANNANNNSTSSNNINNTTSVVAVTATATATASVSTPSFSGFEGEAAASFGGDVGNGRWPRQETLTLLEIRSRLDSKFKETNQKAPLWDEVSRIMCEEHGYQRSGKKCREKFENLYKYYKKTREGKAGRQDGKHYRFFRQLEALYGDITSNSSSVQETHLIGSSSLLYNHSTTHHQDQLTTIFPSSHKLCDHSISLSNNNNSSQFDSSSSDDNDLSIMDNDSTEINRRNKKRGSRSGWKVKVKEFIDLQMRKLMEKQEAWLENLTKTLEQKEQDRVLREEQWRRQEQERIDREHKFWAKERAWIEARDAVLTEALQNIKGKKLKTDDQSPTEDPMAAAARLQLNDIDSSSPAGAASNNTNNICNAVSDSCFRYLMADGDHLWENYGLKLSNNGENQISE